MAAVLLTGARVLADLGASRSAQLLFVVLTALWSPWAELLSGYYILTCFVVIVWLSLVAWLAYRRWQRERSAGSLLVFGAAQLIAPAIELSGLYVIAAAAVFVGIELIDTTRVPKLRARIKTQAPALAVIAFAAGLSAAAMAYVYLVLHPGTFLGMASTGGRSLVRITVDLFYAFDVGLLVAMVVPFIYARLPGLLLVAAAVAAFAAWALFLAKAARVADADRRRHLLAALLVSLGICLMVILGRPPEGQIAVRWAAKHVGPAYVWLCVVIALGWDTLWRNSPARARLAEFKLLAAVVFVGAQTAFGLLGMAVSFPPFGYPAEIRDARARRQAVEALRRNIVEKFQTPDLVPLSIPTLDGEFIRRRHPSLFIYNLSHYEPFFAAAQPLPRLLSGPGMQTWRTTAVQTTPRLRDAVSPRFLERLGVDPELRDYYLGEITLVPEKNSGRQTPPTPLPGGAPMIAGNGFAERMVRAAAFDPEETPRLFIWVSRTSKTASSSGSPPIIATIVFNSEISGGDWSGRIELPADPACPLVIDLRQVYAFSLSRQVSRLRLIVSEADSHRLHLVKLSP